MVTTIANARDETTANDAKERQVALNLRMHKLAGGKAGCRSDRVEQYQPFQSSSCRITYTRSLTMQSGFHYLFSQDGSPSDNPQSHRSRSLAWIRSDAWKALPTTTSSLTYTAIVDLLMPQAGICAFLSGLICLTIDARRLEGNAGYLMWNVSQSCPPLPQLRLCFNHISSG